MATDRHSGARTQLFSAMFLVCTCSSAEARQHLWMSQPVDTSSFPTGENLNYESKEELDQLEVLRAEASR